MVLEMFCQKINIYIMYNMKSNEGLFKSVPQTWSGGKRKARKTARKTKRKSSTMKRKRAGKRRADKSRAGKRRAGKSRAGKSRAGKRRADKRRISKRTRYKMRGG
jgi:hypothetical protein